MLGEERNELDGRRYDDDSLGRIAWPWPTLDPRREYNAVCKCGKEVDGLRGEDVVEDTGVSGRGDCRSNIDIDSMCSRDIELGLRSSIPRAELLSVDIDLWGSADNGEVASGGIDAGAEAHSGGRSGPTRGSASGTYGSSGTMSFKRLRRVSQV